MPASDRACGLKQFPLQPAQSYQAGQASSEAVQRVIDKRLNLELALSWVFRAQAV
jgi:hypothetical protein